MTQHMRILEYMERRGGITSMEAFTDLGIVKLSNRIGELRQKGILIGQARQHGTNRYGEPVSYMKYWLEG